MPFSFDTTNPLDASLVSAYPANERAMRGQLDDWATVEHYLTGRHRLAQGSGTGARPTGGDLQSGIVYFDYLDHLLDRYTGAAWVDHAFVPTGALIEVAYNPSSPPRGFLAANGQAVSQTTYARLFAKIGSAFATQGGASAPSAGNFRVPNKGGVIPIGFISGGDGDSDYDTIGEQIDGTKRVTLTQAMLPALNFPVTDPAHFHDKTGEEGFMRVPSLKTPYTGVPSTDGIGGGGYRGQLVSNMTASTGITVASGGSGTPIDIRPRLLVMGYLIRT